MNDEKTAKESLVDSFGRTISYLRLSITDRCNLRCLYCMPPEGVALVSHNDVLSFEEMLRICRILAGLGIIAVRVTGGEPLVRRGAVDFVGRLKEAGGIKRVTMTSNGVLLGEYIKRLAACGLDGVNISLDTLDKEKFRRFAGGDGFDNILAAVDRSIELGLDVKINCVPLYGFNEEDIVKLSELAKNRNIAVRFIELMPLGAASSFRPLPITKVTALIENNFGPMQSVQLNLGNGPAVYYSLPDFTGYIGIISALSMCFCKTCNRLRLTSSGILKPCLSSDMGLDIRSLVRKDACDEEITGLIRELVAQKPERHNFAIDNNDGIDMFRIGG